MDTDYDYFPLKFSSKPVAFHGKTVRSSITQSLWKKIRQEVLKKHNCTCSICGFTTEDTKKLHVHEVESYDFDNGICELTDLNLICIKCHAFQHMGRTEMVSTKEQMNDLIKHFMEVNMCDRFDYDICYLQGITESTRYIKGIPTSYEKVRFTISGDIPYKDEVISQLKKKDLYAKEKDEIRMSEHFINYVIKGKKFDLNDFETSEEFARCHEELSDFIKDPNQDKYRDLFERTKHLRENDE